MTLDCLPLFVLVAVAAGQQVGKLQAEVHPELRLQVDCTPSGCTEESGSVVLDANWRWLHKDGKNCYTDGSWDQGSCSDPTSCAEMCTLEGADYKGTYGIAATRQKDGISLSFVTKHQYGSSVGSRVYVMDSDETYKMFRLKNREIALDVDVSELPCGLNGAVYLVEMDKHGDLDGKGNTAGAGYGTGYCDAQCPHDIKFIKGEANVIGWNESSVPPVGQYGSCCAEMDIWEANSRAAAYTPHPCSQAGLTRCEGTLCGDNTKGERYLGMCDKDGCDFQSYRLGNPHFYGKGTDFAVDTSRPITVVTQFLTEDGTDAGDLSEIRRFYVQDGAVIQNSQAAILGASAGNAITDEFCASQKEMFGDANDFAAKGGLRKMGEALDRGMVLVLSLWDDTDVSMLWLDSAYPPEQSSEKPGVLRGPCPGGAQSLPSYLRSTHPDAQVTYSNIKVGMIDTTFVAKGGRRMGSTFV